MDDTLYAGKVTCGKCEQEVLGYLAGPPDFKITDEVRAMCAERWRLYHEGECTGTLPGWCPSVDSKAPWSERCRIETILKELLRPGEHRHRCYLKVGHNLVHGCSCGRDWKQK
jgi:hypothetical protein